MASSPNFSARNEEEEEDEAVALTAVNPVFCKDDDMFNYIVKDDLAKLRLMLERLPIADRRKLVNAQMKYSDPLDTTFTPLQMACCIGNKAIASYLMSQGADVTHINSQDKNIVYMLVDVAKYRPKMVLDMYQFLMKSCSLVDKRTLLDTRYMKCNPLLYAIKHGELQMAHAIVNTDDIYRHVINTCGTYNVVRYDLQIKGADKHECPIRALLKLGMNQVKTPQNRDIISRRPWATWLSQSWSEYVWIASLWCILRVMHLIFLTLSCVYRPNRLANSTSPLTKAYPKTHDMAVGIEYILLVFSIAALIPNLVRLLSPAVMCKIKRCFVRTCKNMYRTVRRIRRPDEKRFTQGRLFWLLSLLMHVNYILSFIFTYNRWPCEDIALSLSVILCYMSMLFFCTLVPQLGHFAIIIEQTVRDILNFAFFYLFILLGFSAAFYTLYQTEHVEGFTSYWDSVFSVFHMTFDVIGMDTLKRAREPVAAVLCFVIYVTIVVVALLNFLIAILSQTVADITESRQIAFSLNRASVSIFLQEYPFVRKLRKLMEKIAGCSACCQDDKDLSVGLCSATIVEHLNEGGCDSATTYGRSDSVL